MKPERLPSGSYRIRYTDPWGRRRAVTRRTAADARAAHRRILGDIARGDYTDPRRGRVTFAVWCDDWLAGARNLGQGGRDTYRRDLDRHILPALGQVHIGRLSVADIDAYLTEKQCTGVGVAASTVHAQRPPDGRPAKGLAHSPGVSSVVNGKVSKPLAASTVHRHYRTIHRALAVAVDRGLIARNPADKVQPPRVPKREVTVLTVEQIDALADAISPRYRAWVFVAAYGGLRWSETVGLRRMDVEISREDSRGRSLTTGVVRVRGQLVKRPSRRTRGMACCPRRTTRRLPGLRARCVGPARLG